MLTAPSRVLLTVSAANFHAIALSKQIGLVAQATSAGVMVFGGQLSQRKCDEARDQLTKAGYLRLFEDAFFEYGKTPEVRQSLVLAFFDFLNSSYGEAIELERNVGCYEYLLSACEERIAPIAITQLLDFGCGPGTILHSNVPCRINELDGYDFSPSMAILARQTGLRVLTEQEYLRAVTKYQVVLSCYVLHYGCLTEAFFRNTSNCLCIGGAWAANFHKGMFLEEFLQLAKNLRLESRTLESPYGPVAILTRVF